MSVPDGTISTAAGKDARPTSCFKYKIDVVSLNEFKFLLERQKPRLSKMTLYPGVALITGAASGRFKSRQSYISINIR